MCLIVRGRIGDLLDLDLRSAQNANADGWGIHTSRNIAYSFSSREKDIVKFLSGRKKTTVATIHFRYATHGAVNLTNAHPFDLGENQFLMHNGVLHGDHFDHKTKSDTMRLVEILHDAGPLARDYILTSLIDTEWYSNRFCVLNGNSWKTYGDWHHDKSTNTWHSNRTLLGGIKSYIPTAKKVDNDYGMAGEMFWDHELQCWLPFDAPPAASRGRIYHDEEDVLLDEKDPFYSKITF